MPELRPRQIECLDSIRNEYLAGIYQQLVVAATGIGKAVILANIKRHMADLLPGKMLVFAHREELIAQLIATLQEWNPDLKVGKEIADTYADVDCDIVVSCNASIGRDGAKRIARFGPFDYVICDEAHHSIASTYLNVFEQTGVLKSDSTRLLVGFTATPKRKNRVRTKERAGGTRDRRRGLAATEVGVQEDCFQLPNSQGHQRRMAGAFARLRVED